MTMVEARLSRRNNQARAGSLGLARRLLLNDELHGSDHDPHYDRERAKKLENFDAESGHGTPSPNTGPLAAPVGHSCSLSETRRRAVQIWAKANPQPL
jgi:hypothetical protein